MMAMVMMVAKGQSGGSTALGGSQKCFGQVNAQIAGLHAILVVAVVVIAITMARLGLGHQQVTRAVGGGRNSATFVFIVILLAAARFEFDHRRSNGTVVWTGFDAPQQVVVATVGRQTAEVWE